MVDPIDAGFEAAEARGREMMKSEPRAVAAHYDPETGRVAVELANGCTYIFPAQLAQELHGADDEALAAIVVDGAGFNLHWPTIDADLHVPALVAGVFGTQEWMAKQWARAAGRGRSPRPGRRQRDNDGGTHRARA